MAYLYTKDEDGNIVKYPLGNCVAAPNVSSDGVYLVPTSYGAKGDGSTDDTAAMVACINAAYTSRLPIYINKRYKVSGLKIDKDVTFVGGYHRWSNVESNINSTMYDIISETPIEIAFSCTFLGVGFAADLLITGNRVHFRDCAFYLRGTAITLQNDTPNWKGEVTIKNCGFCLCSVGISSPRGSNNKKYTDCEVTGCTVVYGGTFLAGSFSGWIISGNHVYSDNGISIDAANVLFTANYFDCNTTALTLTVRGMVSLTGCLFYNLKRPTGVSDDVIIPCIVASPMGNADKGLCVTGCTWGSTEEQKSYRVFIQNNGVPLFDSSVSSDSELVSRVNTIEQELSGVSALIGDGDIG